MILYLMNKKQLKKDLVYLKMAHDLATLSHCAKIQVGAIMVLKGRVIGSGINGTPEGHPNCDEIHVGDFDHATHRSWSDANELHAEMNLIAFAAKEGISLEGATIYSTLQPCSQCTKNLTASGAIRIVYDEAYDRMSETDRKEAEKFLKLSKIKYEHIPLT